MNDPLPIRNNAYICILTCCITSPGGFPCSCWCSFPFRYPCDCVQTAMPLGRPYRVSRGMVRCAHGPLALAIPLRTVNLREHFDTFAAEQPLFSLAGFTTGLSCRTVPRVSPCVTFISRCLHGRVVAYLMVFRSPVSR